MEVDQITAVIQMETKITVAFPKGKLQDFESGKANVSQLKDILINQANMQLNLLPSSSKIVKSNCKALIEK